MMLKTRQAKQQVQEATPAQVALDGLVAYIELNEITTTEALEVISLYRDLCYATWECTSTQEAEVLRSGDRLARRSKTNTSHVVVI